MHVDLELGGATRRLALNENAIIALFDLCGEDFFALGQRLGAKTHDENGNPILGEDGKPIAPVLHAEKMRITRLLVWTALSQSQKWDGRPETLRTVGEWIADQKKKIAAMEAVGKLIENYLESMGVSAKEFEGQLAPFVPTPRAVVERMIALADLGPGKHAVDLGAGDGRLMFAALDAGASVSGYELHEGRLEALRAALAKRTDSDRGEACKVDIRNAFVGSADVVFLYLLQSSNAELKSKLLAECKSGALVISHDFSMPDWEPLNTEYTYAEGRSHTIYVYRVPGATPQA